jgi:Na+/melibiose symporter-like transporter
MIFLKKKKENKIDFGLLPVYYKRKLEFWDPDRGGSASHVFVMSRHIPFAYGCVSFGASAMQSLFITYYVTLYLSVYQLSSAWFFFGETVFLIWNSLNDPLFGVLLRSQSIRDRLPALNGGGALWVLSFALFFLLPLPASPVLVGVHFLAALLLYDTFLSYVLLVHASLLADICSNPIQRASCNAWSSGCSIFGSCFVFIANVLWNESDIASFRMFCLVVAFLSLLSFQISYSMLQDLNDPEMAEPVVLNAPEPSLKDFASDLLSHRNFWVFAGVNLLQVFNCHFNSNFLALSMNQMLSPGFSASTVSFLLSLTAILPHVVVVALR